MARREFKDREDDFVNAAKHTAPYNEDTWALYYSFGASNSVLPVPLEERVYFSGPNLQTFHDSDYQGIAIVTVARFITGQEIYVACYIQRDIEVFKDRLRYMLELAPESEGIYAQRNNNARLVLNLQDRQFYLFNSNKWENIDIGDTHTLPSFSADKIIYAIFPPGRQAKQSLAAGEFIRFLIQSFGQEKVEEIPVWQEETVITASMQIHPAEIDIDIINQSIRSQGLYYTDELVSRLHVALNHLNHKHFVILTGISGTGKTQLAISYSRAVHGLNRNQNDPLFFMCAVRPEWTDPTGLTGYYDVIAGEYIVPPFLEAILMALVHPLSPIFVCLDEMNLARVEYYFSDVLSAIESGQPLNLHSYNVPIKGSTGIQIPRSVRLPNNLYIIGSVNVDETTFPISDKVLDRAVVIDTSEVDLDGFLELLSAKVPSLARSVSECGDTLSDIYNHLPRDLRFGYRVAEEFIRYHDFATGIGVLSNQTIDNQIVQKLLVKLRGDERHRNLLAALHDLFDRNGYDRAAQEITRLIDELNTLGSFQYAR